jgi:hypothetical protein
MCDNVRVKTIKFTPNRDAATGSPKLATDFIETKALLNAVPATNIEADASERDLKAASRANRKFRLSGAR